MNDKFKTLIRAVFSAAEDGYDKMLVLHRRHTEIKKMQDPRRVKIAEQITLSEKQKKEIDDYYIENYGEKIPHIWHQYYTAYTGKFDAKYLPELLYIPEFEYYMNRRNDYADVFVDKNVTPMIANSVGVKTPRVILSVTAGVFKDGNGNLISRNEAIEALRDVGEGFVKPTVDTGSAQGCAVIDIKDGIDQNSGRSLDAIVRELGNNFVIQERIKTHKTVSDLHENSVNTFRIMTYRWKNTIEHAPIIMRIGQSGNVVDNAHAGGMFIAVDDNGNFHDTAFTEFNQKFTEHPDTHIVYDGYKIDLVPEVIKTAKKLHSAIPQIGVVNWDITLDVAGAPILIEANILGAGIWLFEMAHGCGAFGDRTGEILQWVREQKNMRKSKRHDGNGFGWMV